MFPSPGNCISRLYSCLHAALVAMFFLLVPMPGRAQEFIPLGDLPGGIFYSDVSGISADGSTVVGSSSSANGDYEAFRWTTETGMVGMGFLPVAGGFESYAIGVSADGSTVVGISRYESESGRTTEAFRWTADTGMVGLGFLPSGISLSYAHGVSADGSTVVGYSYDASDEKAFRWTADTGMVSLGTLPGGTTDRSHAYGVSADGSTVVGRSYVLTGGATEAFRWTVDTGKVGLGDLPGSAVRSVAVGVSADGSTVVGWGYTNNDTAFRWTAETGMVGLVGEGFSNTGSYAFGVSGDGSTVVGTGRATVDGNGAFVWDAANGMRSIKQILESDGLDLTGWRLTDARAVSDDGFTIAGYGTNPGGATEGWLARIAREFRWIEANGGLFSEGQNWSPGSAPGAENTAIFDLAGAYTITLEENVTNQGLTVSGDGVHPTLDLAGHQYSMGELRISDQAALTFTGGAAEMDGHLKLGVGTGADGTVTIAGEGSKLTAKQGVTVGQDGQGLLWLRDGGAAEVKGPVKLGVEAGSDGAITIAGEGSKLTAKQGVTVAQAGHALLWVREGGAAAISEKLKLGIEVGATGNVLVEDEDSKLELKGDITIGDGGIGNVSVLAGGKVETKELKDDDDDVVAEGKTKVGAELGSTGRLLVDGAGSKFISKAGLTLGDKGNGTLEVSGGGAVTAPSAKFGSEPVSFGVGTIEGAGSKLTINGSLTLGEGGTGRLTVSDGVAATATALKLGNHLNAIGELTVTGTDATFTIEGGLTAGVLGNAEVLVQAGGQLSAATLVIADGLSVANVAVTVEGAGSLLSTGDTVVGKQGVGSLVIRDGGRVNSGMLPVFDPADPDLPPIDPGIPASATIGLGVFAQGTALISGAGSMWEVGGELVVGDGGFGMVQVEQGGLLATAGGRLGATENEGPGHVTIINPNSRWISTEAIVIAGTSPVGGTGTGQGILNILDGATVDAPQVTLGNGGLLAGVGQITGNVVQNGGVIAAGTSPGTLTIDGDYEQGPGGVLEVEFAGLGAGQFDTLIVTGDATFDGVVELAFLDGFAPQQGQQFEFLNVGGAADLTGASFEIQNLAPGFMFDIMPSGAGVSMTALNDGVFLQPVSWNVDADGDWSLAENWSAGDPNASGVSASFLDATTAPRTVNIDAPQTVARLTFDNENGYTLSGPGLLQFSNGGQASVQVTSGEHVISAPLSIAEGNTLTKRGGGTLTISGVQSHGAGAVLVANAGATNLNSDGGPNLSVQADANLNFGASQHLAGVTIGEGGTATLTAGGTNTLVTSVLSIAGGDTPTGTLDLTDNAAVIDFPEGGENPAATIRSQILTGRGGSGLGRPWNGPGITSSQAQADVAMSPNSTSIGYAVNSEMPLGAVTTFGGQPVDPSSVLIRYTRTADANLDGVVNDDDVTIVGALYAPGVPNARWSHGDFDYNGFVDDDDVTLLGVFYNPSAPPLPAPGASVSAVPEPGTVALLVAGLLGILLAVVRRKAR